MNVLSVPEPPKPIFSNQVVLGHNVLEINMRNYAYFGS